MNGNGLFTKKLCDNLRGGIFDYHGRPLVNLQDVFSYTKKLVVDESNHTMTPMDRDILQQHFGEQCSGEFLFLRPT